MQAALDPTEKEAAASIYPLVSQNHRLMCTLLVMNSLAYECLPLFLDKLLPTWMTIIFSVSLLLVFGEVRQRILQLFLFDNFIYFFMTITLTIFLNADYPNCHFYWPRPIDVCGEIGPSCICVHDNVASDHVSVGKAT